MQYVLRRFFRPLRATAQHTLKKRRESLEASMHSCWGDKIRLTEEINVSPRAVGQGSCACQSFNPKTLLRMSYNLLHGGTHEFPLTKHTWSPQPELLRDILFVEVKSAQISATTDRTPRFCKCSSFLKIYFKHSEDDKSVEFSIMNR